VSSTRKRGALYGALSRRRDHRELGIADMRIPIAYALSFPHRLKGSWRPLDLTRHGELSFLPVEKKRYPALSLAYAALREEGRCRLCLTVQ
jgi:1-deoxy-D-xylulose 5-phosphate reductoisomerase